MGSEPSEVDAVMFSIVVTILDTMEGAPYYVLVHEKMTNLVAYSQRMKQRFWPDYDECCYHDKKPEPGYYKTFNIFSKHIQFIEGFALTGIFSDASKNC